MKTKGEDRLMLMKESLRRSSVALSDYCESRNKKRIRINSNQDTSDINTRIYLNAMKSSQNVFNDCLRELFELEENSQ